MAFELREKTTVKVQDVRILASKDRQPDEPPGAQLLLQADLPVSALAMFDGFLPGMLYRKAGSGQQGKLDGLEGMELTSIGEHVKRMPWAYEQTGCAVSILRATSTLDLDDCNIHGVNFQPQKNGGVRVQWKVDAPALTDATRGTLTSLKATEIDLTFTGPEVDDSQNGIPGTEGTDPDKVPAGGWPFPKKGQKPAADPQVSADATEAFLAAQKGSGRGKAKVVLDGKH